MTTLETIIKESLVGKTISVHRYSTGRTACKYLYVLDSRPDSELVDVVIKDVEITCYECETASIYIILEEGGLWVELDSELPIK
jgi:hypothetical protein